MINRVRNVEAHLFDRGTYTSRREPKRSDDSLFVPYPSESLSLGKGDVTVVVLSPAES